MFLSVMILALLFSPFGRSSKGESLAPSCQIPIGITIYDAEDPCWTMEWIKEQYAETEQDVAFSRWLTDKPYTFNSFETLTLQVVEHPRCFLHQ